MAREFITIEHPDIEGTGEASREAFEKVWKHKGFTEVQDAPDAAARQTGRTAEDSSKPQQGESPAKAPAAGVSETPKK